MFILPFNLSPGQCFLIPERPPESQRSPTERSKAARRGKSPGHKVVQDVRADSPQAAKGCWCEDLNEHLPVLQTVFGLYYFKQPTDKENWGSWCLGSGDVFECLAWLKWLGWYGPQVRVKVTRALEMRSCHAALMSRMRRERSSDLWCFF